MRIAEASAKTRKEAIQKALDKLGCELHEVEIEIIDEGSGGFLGIGARDVQVRLKAEHLPGNDVVRVDEEHDAYVPDDIGNRADGPDLNMTRDEAAKKAQRQGQRRGGREIRRPRGQQRPVRGAQGGGQGGQGGGNRQQQPARGEGGNGPRGQQQQRQGGRGPYKVKEGGERPARPQQDSPRGDRERGGNRDRGRGRGPRPERDRGPRRERSENRERTPRPPRRFEGVPHSERPKRKVRETPIDRAAAEETGKQAAALLKELIDQMGMPCEVKSYLNEDDNIVLDVASEDSAILIGRKGRTLQSLQFLMNRLVLNSEEDDVVDRILVDVAEYQKRRKESLEEMAHALAQKAKDLGRPVRVKPLDPHERRIVHLALEKDEEVRTYSLGSALHRRVVIAPANGDDSSLEDGIDVDDEFDDDADDSNPEAVTSDAGGHESDEN